MPAAGDDRGAFEQLYHELYPLVVRTVYLTIFDRDAAQEIAHEAFLRLWQHREQLADAANVRAWLMRVAINLSFERRRRFLTALRHRFIPRVDSGAAETGPDRADRGDLQRPLLALSHRDRALLALRFEQELSFSEIGRVLGLPEAAVKTSIRRALDRLQLQLDSPEGVWLVEA